MRVIIDALSLIPGELGGGESYMVGLVNGLARADRTNDYTIVVSALGRSSFRVEADNIHYYVLPFDNRSRLLRVLYEQIRFVSLVKKLGGADVVHFPGNMISLSMSSHYPTVVTIHDLAQRFYLRHYPAHTSRLRAWLLLALLKYAAKHADLVVTDSDFSQAEICAYTGVTPAHVQTVRLASRRMVRYTEDPTPILARYGITPPYIFAVGRSNKHKNFDGLVKAFARACQLAILPHSLVIGGLPGTGHQDLLAAIATTGLENRVRLIGYMDSADLSVLYQAADMFAMPSFYEGFGVPALEAMQLGVPTLLATHGSLPEIGGPASMYCDPHDLESMAQAIRQMLTDNSLRRRLGEAGVAQAACFSWEATAQTMVNIYKHVANSGQNSSR